MMKMSSFDINFENVKSLIKSSKQLQHKIRKELGLQSKESSIMTEYNEQVIAASRSQIKSSPKPNQAINSNNFPTTKPYDQKVTKQKHSKRRAKPNILDSMISYERMPASVRTPNSGNYKKQIQVPIKAQSRDIENTLKASKTSLESKKFTSTSSNRLPLQRFVDSVNKNTSFSIEHPELELEYTPEQLTLFPRRFKKAACDSLLKSEDSINLVQAQVRPKQKTSIHPKIEKETWNGILMQNHVKKRPKPKSFKIKNNTATQDNLKDNINEAIKNIDIISSVPAKGLFNLQRQSEQSDKKKKCNVQRFPVLFIRPQCRIQKLASISLQGEIEGVSKLTTTDSSPPGNVKYCVCKHEENNNYLEKEQLTNKAMNDTINQAEMRECETVCDSKFYKPLEFVDLPDILSSSSTKSSKVSSLSSPSVSFATSSCSVDNVNHSTNSDDIDPLRNAVLTNSPKNRREVYVQTENKYDEKVSTNTTSSFKAPLPEATASAVLQMDNNSASTKITKATQSVEKNAEDDIIAKIFERILNDLPDALQSFKTRNEQTSFESTAIRTLSSPSQRNKEYQNEAQQLSTINDELILNKIQPQLDHIQSKLQEERQEFPIQSCEGAETNAIHKKTLHWDKLNLEEQIHPTNEEIKRAAKMFIDSLKTDDSRNVESSDEEKAISSNLSPRQKAFRKSYFKTTEFTNARLKHYTSSESCSDLSFTSKNIKNKNQKVIRKQISCSSTSSSSSLFSSDLDSECDIPNYIRLRSIENNDDSDMSFGEVKSLGEV